MTPTSSSSATANNLSRQAESDAEVVAALTSVPKPQDHPTLAPPAPREVEFSDDDDPDDDVEEDFLDEDLEWS